MDDEVIWERSYSSHLNPSLHSNLRSKLYLFSEAAFHSSYPKIIFPIKNNFLIFYTAHAIPYCPICFVFVINFFSGHVLCFPCHIANSSVSLMSFHPSVSRVEPDGHWLLNKYFLNRAVLKIKLCNINKMPHVMCGPLYNNKWSDKVTWE